MISLNGGALAATERSEPGAFGLRAARPARVAPIALDAALPPLERSMAALPLLAVDVPRSFNASPSVRHAID